MIYNVFLIFYFFRLYRVVKNCGFVSKVKIFLDIYIILYGNRRVK